MKKEKIEEKLIIKKDLEKEETFDPEKEKDEDDEEAYGVEEFEANFDIPNDANIPVHCFLFEDEDEDEKLTGLYRWIASNYMPRKSMISDEDEYQIIDTKKNIQDFIKRRVIPLYKAAIHNLETSCELYYWEQKKGKKGKKTKC